MVTSYDDSKEWIQFILENPEKQWDYYGLSRNANVTWEIIQENPQIEWDVQGYSLNPNITLNIVLENPEINWDFTILSRNPSITEEDVENHPELPWFFGKEEYMFEPNNGICGGGLSSNPSMSLQFIEKNKNKMSMNDIFKNPNITIEFALKYFSEENLILYSKYCNDIAIFTHPEINISYKRLSSNTKILTYDYVKTHPTQKWDYKLLSENPIITWDIVKQNIYNKWDFFFLCKNPSVTWEDFKEITDFCSKNENMCYYEFFDYVQYFSLNPNLTWNIIRENPDLDWNFENISMNNMTKDPHYKNICKTEYILK